MDFYFGVDLLHHLQRHYEQRLSLALSKSFNQADSATIGSSKNSSAA